MTEIPDRLRAALADRYSIEKPLGAGGMATVYLAEDIKHGRKVAIKVLRPELAAVIGGERFVTEIRTTAALQHPHILPLFDSGEAESFLYYVMPYVEGESLRDRLDRDKQLPVDEAIRIARGIGSALQYAHERDIVHRDIKPANILIHAGEPVVADFGIAIAISAAGGGRLTETGMSVGTPHYMSPEQASADRDVDARSDTYSLACLLYEMLAGDPPHTGPSAQAVLMRILTENPRDITDVRRSVPPHVRDALNKGLEKLAADRFPSAKAFSDALIDPGFHYHPVVVDATVTALPAVRQAGGVRSRGWRVALPLIGALTGLAAGAALFGGDVSTDGAGQPTTRFEFGLGEGVEIHDPVVIRISPDGGTLGFIGERDGVEGVFIRRISDLEFRHLAGTEDARFMTFSPEGDRLAFTKDDGGLYIISNNGGAAREIVPISVGVFPPTWNLDGTVTFGTEGPQGFYVGQIPASGGVITPLWDVVGPPPFHVEKIPGSSGVIYSLFTLPNLMLFDMDADSSRVLIPGARDAHILSTGHLAWVDDRGGVWAAPFDADALDFTGEPIPLFTGVGLSDDFLPAISFSRNGSLVYLEGSAGGADGLLGEDLMVIDFEGGRTRIPVEGRRYRSVKWSPDGNSVAFAALQPGEAVGPTSLYTYNVSLRTATRRLPIPSLMQAFPIWSPDGRRIAFLGADEVRGLASAGFAGIDAGDLFAIDIETGQLSPMQSTPTQDVPYAWTEAAGILHSGGSDNLSSDIMVWDPDGANAPSTYLDIDGDLGAHTVSPDGKWIAHRVSLGGDDDTHIAVRTFPEPGPPIRITAGAGDRPRWSQDGSAIYYWLGGQVDSLMRARVRTLPSFELIGTDVVLTGDYSNLSSWDLHPDGDRIVIAMQAQGQVAVEEAEPVPTRWVAVMNWFTEFRDAMGEGGN